MFLVAFPSTEREIAAASLVVVAAAVVVGDGILVEFVVAQDIFRSG